MRIEIGEYVLVQQLDTFDLIWDKPSEGHQFIKQDDGSRTRERTGEISNREVLLGYNMSIYTCQHKIVMNNLSNQELTLSMEQWLKLYIEENQKVINIFKQLKLM